ncbi:GNAT superfamily N-acetyltransferase [Paraburkholderia youngii]|uniref:GNAT superfamily N-acetyltransferase n=1 Tax=Paraburkholderia youngii TaxID=2782701 RepID=A0A7W8P585_9BURK|nr:GNAT superfamily N-acetyltransferase [Paraburkholderia youngii]
MKAVVKAVLHRASETGRIVRLHRTHAAIILALGRRALVGQERTFDTSAKIVNNRVDPIVLAEEVASSRQSFQGPLPVNISFCNATLSDADTLVAIRIAAMRESLERIGRFDPQRARERFLASFDPALCRFIEVDGVQSGFVQIRPQEDHWLLDHFYILPEHQGKGIGAAVLHEVFATADVQRMPIRLLALRGSDSNRFYQRYGFIRTGEAEWDIHYVRQPS